MKFQVELAVNFMPDSEFSLPPARTQTHWHCQWHYTHKSKVK